MANIIVQTTFREILNAPYWNAWDDFCKKYGYSVWCVNEGADSNTEVSISYSDAKLYGIIK